MNLLARYKDDLMGLSFYMLMSVLLGANGIIGIGALIAGGRQTVGLLVALLFVVQISLFWLNVREPQDRRWWLFYYLAQTIIIVVITFSLRQLTTSRLLPKLPMVRNAYS